MIRIIVFFLFLGCQHVVESEAERQEFGHNISNRDYVQHFKNHAFYRGYSGLVNTFQIRAKFLDYKTIEYINRKKASLYQWSLDELQDQIQKTNADAAGNSVVFISFYSRSKGDLKDWHVHIMVDDIRYEAVIDEADDIKLFPFKDRWSGGYYAKFAIPTSQLESYLENSDVKLVITSEEGGGKVTLR